MSFPKDFIWGTAAAAYQVEGAAREDGRGLSVWDVFCDRKGSTFQGENGDVACDHYHRYKEDVGLMREMGIQSYRLSTSWPRILPNGTGQVNPKGLDFYDQLVDELMANQITPFITLFHWDFPLELYKKGGWLNRDSANWFADYTTCVVERLSDRVKNWITINEHQSFIGLGHQDDIQAPGLKLPLHLVLEATHNSLRAHGKSVQAIRASAKQPAQVGFAPVGFGATPASDTDADRAAAARTIGSVLRPDLYNNTWFMDPVFRGEYPEDGRRVYGEAVPTIHPGDMEDISAPVDYFGVNNYASAIVKADENGDPELVPPPSGHPQTAMDWLITPAGFRTAICELYRRYPKPVYVMENGLAVHDVVSVDGKVHDPQRIDFLTRHLQELHTCIQQGVDVRGYHQWSVMDNFEWSFGYTKRFGLIHVDYQTLKRTMKDSAYWYRDVIASNGANIL